MLDHSEDFFYLIDHDGNRRVPILINARDGRHGYAIHPKGKGNDASAAEYTTDNKRLIEAVVLEGRGVRCRARGGPHDGQANTLGLSGRVIRGYWVAPEYLNWVQGAQLPLNDDKGQGVTPAPRPTPAQPSIKPSPMKERAQNQNALTTSGYFNRAAFQFKDYCCQGGHKALPAGDFRLGDLTIAEEDRRRLRFSPLGNRPKHPKVALVGITPGGQVERFAANLAKMDVSTAVSDAAFNGAQSAIKELLNAHGLARHIGVALDGDLNKNDDVLTTSIVKCCLMVDENYRFSAPDIAASASATYCATTRFVDEILSYPTLKWVLIFGGPGWDALHELRRDGSRLIDILQRAGLKVLQLPHFAQNFQQRALFALSSGEETGFIQSRPDYAKYAPGARGMRDAVLKSISV